MTALTSKVSILVGCNNSIVLVILALLLAAEAVPHASASCTGCSIGGAGTTFSTNTQADIDSLDLSSCTVLCNSLQFGYSGGNVPIHNFEKFASITRIGGDVSIYGSSFSNFTIGGFRNLVAVDGALIVSKISLLADLSGLQSLTSVSGTMLVEYMPDLVSLNGLGNLTTVGLQLSFSYNPGLLKAYLPSLQTVSGALSLSSMDAITNITLPRVAYIGDRFTLLSLPLLQFVSLPALTTIKGNLQITAGSSAGSFTSLSLPNLVYIYGDDNSGINVEVSSNLKLRSISVPRLAYIGGTRDVAFSGNPDYCPEPIWLQLAGNARLKATNPSFCASVFVSLLSYTPGTLPPASTTAATFATLASTAPAMSTTRVSTTPAVSTTAKSTTLIPTSTLPATTTAKSTTLSPSSTPSSTLAPATTTVLVGNGDGGGGGSSIGLPIGAAIAGVVAAVLIALFIALGWKKRRSGRVRPIDSEKHASRSAFEMRKSTENPYVKKASIAPSESSASSELSSMHVSENLLLSKPKFAPKSSGKDTEGYSLPYEYPLASDPRVEFQLLAKHSVSRSTVHFKRMLGEGAFGEVHLADATDLPGVKRGASMQIAVKMLKANSGDEDEKEFIEEASVIAELHHPNIVRFLGVCIEQKPYLLLLEFMRFGDLKRFLYNTRPANIGNRELWKATATPARRAPEHGSGSLGTDERPYRASMMDIEPPTSAVSVQDLTQFMYQVSCAMEYLESQKFVHRDLAARNCMVGDAGVVKVADFGLSRSTYTSDYYRKQTRRPLPVKWMSPEAMNDLVFTSKTDVWAFAITSWEIWTRGMAPYPEFRNQDMKQALKSGYRLEKPDECPPEIFFLIQRCWEYSPDKRPTFSEIRQELESLL